MRVCLLIISLITPWATDTIANRGAYQRAFWQEAERQADIFNSEVARFIPWS
jgi:hypothetical protein